MSDPEELQWFTPMLQRKMDPFDSSSRRVFLYEVSQLSDTEREPELRADLQKFLRLKEPISPMIWYKPGRNHSDLTDNQQERLKSKKIDICDREYSALRQVLLEQAVSASQWIRNFFVHAPSVVVSSKEHFVNELMPSWERDPCLDRTTSKVATG